MNAEDDEAADVDWFRRGLKSITSGYVHARTHERLSANHPLCDVGKRLRIGLESLRAVRDREHLRVRWSFGMGVWARIPWIALLDARVARGTSDGVYIIYLFREDMTGVYATLNQGVTKTKESLGAGAGRRAIRERCIELRPLAMPLAGAGFSLSNALDLRTRNSLGNEYEHGTIAHRLYESPALPSTALLLDDLQILIEVYGVIAKGLQPALG